jgi:hypothetical protein
MWLRVGESEEWTDIVNMVEENCVNFCKALHGRTLYSALYGTYSVNLKELKGLVKAGIFEEEQSKKQVQPTVEEGFQEVRRRKRHGTDESAKTAKKAAVQAKVSPSITKPPAKEVTTRNFFAPLHVAQMDTEAPTTEGYTSEDTTAGKPGRPPPIILTTPINLIQLQKQLKDVVAETFEFCNTRNGTRVLTKSLVDFQSIKSYFNQHQLSYFSFFPKSEKPIKAVIRHLPINTPEENTSDGPVNLSFDIISVKQMTTTCRSSPYDPKPTNLPHFLITLPRSEKSQEIF